MQGYKVRKEYNHMVDQEQKLFLHECVHSLSHYMNVSTLSVILLVTQKSQKTRSSVKVARYIITNLPTTLYMVP